MTREEDLKDERVARYTEAIRSVVRGHHPRCFQVRPEGIPDDLPRDLCDCRILWMLTASAEHERAEAAEAKLRAVEALADEWHRLSGWPSNVAVPELRAALSEPATAPVLDSHLTGTPEGGGGL